MVGTDPAEEVMMVVNWLLWTTRNGQHQWDGPFTRERAEVVAASNLHCLTQGYQIVGNQDQDELLREAARGTLEAYQRFLDTDDLDGLRDALTELQEAL
jgi:hypothetical protein